MSQPQRRLSTQDQALDLLFQVSDETSFQLLAMPSAPHHRGQPPRTRWQQVVDWFRWDTQPDDIYLPR